MESISPSKLCVPSRSAILARQASTSSSDDISPWASKSLASRTVRSAGWVVEIVIVIIALLSCGSQLHFGDVGQRRDPGEPAGVHGEQRVVVQFPGLGGHAVRYHGH